MGKLWVFRFFDGSVEAVRDGGLGRQWVADWARSNLPICDVWQVSSVNFIRSGYDFFNPIN